MYSNGPRGKNKPKITDKAVIKLPPMSKIERGYSEAKAAKVNIHDHTASRYYSLTMIVMMVMTILT